MVVVFYLNITNTTHPKHM